MTQAEYCRQEREDVQRLLQKVLNMWKVNDRGPTKNLGNNILDHYATLDIDNKA